jgi:tRNA nucleotidyltransferase/poly(A) polymerase
MEIDYMLAYGSGEASLRLLWKFGLLDILLPFQVDVHYALNFSSIME